MSVEVVVEGSAFADARFEYLAKILGYSGADHARGAVIRLLFHCGSRGTFTSPKLPIWVVEQILGSCGPEALVEAELGTFENNDFVTLSIGCMWPRESEV